MKPLITSLAAGALLAAIATAQSPRYSIVDLGVLPAPGQPYDVTNNGIVGGVNVLPDNTEHAMIWYLGLGLRADIGKPGLGGPNSVGLTVNQKGQSAGYAQTKTTDSFGEDYCGFSALGFGSSGTCLPFLWQSGVMSALPTLGGNNGMAEWMNNNGDVVGSAENTTRDPACPAPQLFQSKPVVWQKGKIQELPAYPGDLNGIAYGINDNGDIAGESGLCTAFSSDTLSHVQPLHAILWQSGVPTYLGDLGGTGHGNGIGAFGLNNKAQVVGFSDLPGDQTTHAFLWSKGSGMQDLGVLPGDVYSFGVAVSDSGQVVGLSADENFNTRGFLWQNGVISDLNSLIPASSPLYLMLACSIDASGLIAGQAVNKKTGETHGYLAVPVAALSPKDRATFEDADGAPAVTVSAAARRAIHDRSGLGRQGARIPKPQ